MRNKTRRYIAALCSLGMATATLMATSSVASAEPERTNADDSNLSGAVLAHGKIVDRAGKAVSAGVPVTLFAWPSQELMAKQQVGESLTLTPIASARTANDGSFALRGVDDRALAAFASTGGSVDLEVIAPDSSGNPITHSFSTTTTDVRNASSLSAKLGATADAPVVADGITLAQDQASDAGPENATVDWSTYSPKAICNAALISNLGPRWVIVGEGYSAAAGVKHLITYSKGATSSIGVGTSLSGAYGSFSSSGTLSRSSTATITFPTGGAGAKRQYATQYTFGKYMVSCADPLAGVSYNHWETRAISFAGGATYNNVSAAPTATHCNSYKAGAKFDKISTSAVNWTNGANLKPVIGIDLSIKSGFSTTVKAHYEFTSTRQLCGSNDYAAGTPYRIVSK